MPFGECSIDGFAADCAEVARRAAHGSVVFEVTFNSGERRQISPRDIGLGYVPSSVFVDEWVYEVKEEDTTVTVIGAEVGEEDESDMPPSSTIRRRNVGRWVDTGFSFVLIGGGLRGGRSNPQRPGRAPDHPTVPIQNLRGHIEKMLGKGDCGKFVQQLLDEAADQNPRNTPRAKTILEAFDNISSQGGFQLTTGIGYHTVSGDYYVYREGAPGVMSAMAHIIPWYNLSGRPPSVRTVAMAQAYYAKAALHETFHLAARGGFTDKQMALAAFALTGAAGLPRSDEEAGLYGYSDYWDNRLTEHCPELKVK